ncbi:hypothetical protein AA106555_1835 [Neokomagataea thailandica NBRC 106555]|uniref:Transposase n=1 Tax=Neokomagataea thailandica NBRC 106555 TaxID=1223520 RepID=A0ABQ0QS40_9PROT|nr:hypothetical protein AA106555_1835 [Neokomagataea thailandica NBRC 106555]
MRAILAKANQSDWQAQRHSYQKPAKSTLMMQHTKQGTMQPLAPLYFPYQTALKILPKKP